MKREKFDCSSAKESVAPLVPNGSGMMNSVTQRRRLQWHIPKHCKYSCFRKIFVPVIFTLHLNFLIHCSGLFLETRRLNVQDAIIKYLGKNVWFHALFWSQNKKPTVFLNLLPTIEVLRKFIPKKITASLTSKKKHRYSSEDFIRFSIWLLLTIE